MVGTKLVANCTKEEIIKMLSGSIFRKDIPKLIKSWKNCFVGQKFGFEDKLENISFDLAKGEILGVTGLAGSADTLANCLFGAVETSPGKYF